MSIPITKTARTLQASATNSAGQTATGASLDLRSALGLLLSGRITNGATPPTAPCEMIVQVSPNGSTWREYSRQAAGLAASATYEFIVELGPEILWARTVFTGNTAQSVTIEAEGQELSAIG